jgi:predicted nucleotidyltransferase component of viral defense system
MIALNEIVRQYPVHMQQSGFYDQMVKEYLHHQMLRLLFNGKQAGKICLLGGTALRYFYGARRFSEDLGFDCFDLGREEFVDMTERVRLGIAGQGYDVHADDKKKADRLTAFRRIFVFLELKYKLGLTRQKEARFFIKIEAEPQSFEYRPEVKLLHGFGVSTAIRVMPPDILFSSKIAAAIGRKKDRDFFDVISMVDLAAPDFDYLRHRCNIRTAGQLKQALLEAAADRGLEKRRTYDCKHILFDKGDKEKLHTFTDYIRQVEFKRKLASP